MNIKYQKQKESQKRYREKPEVKERYKKYHKIYNKKYYQRSEVKTQIKEREIKNKLRRKEWQNEYFKIPEVIIKRRGYSKKYYHKPEINKRILKYQEKYKREQLEKIAGRKKPKICEVCGLSDRICFDHDHKTNKFRGWICHRCNVVLGISQDNIELLLKLVEYLKKNDLQ